MVSSPNGRKKVDGLNVLKCHTPGDEELAQARNLPPDCCPRRYCWWWRSLLFEWDTSVADGCRFLSVSKPDGWKNTDIPCCRSDSSSSIDHYEPREPHLIDDGFDPEHWTIKG